MTTTLRELLTTTTSGFPPERLARLDHDLAEDHRTEMPWYLRVIVGIGAWLASFFFLGFIAVLLGNLERDQTTIGIIGLLFLAGAIAVDRLKLGFFAEQAALSVSFAGQVMIYIGFAANDHDGLGLATLVAALLATVLYVAFPSFVSRLATCFVALELAYMWLQSHDRTAPDQFAPLIYLAFWTLQLIGIGAIFLSPRRVFVPLGYALVGSLVVWEVEPLWNFFWYMHPASWSYVPPFLFTLSHGLRLAFAAAMILGVAVWAAGGLPVLRQKRRMFAALVLALITVAALGSTGVLLALLFLLLGFALQNRVLLTLGLPLLAVFIWKYYYDLQLDLLAKSGLLIASGAMLLVLRAGIVRGFFEEKS